ncbi:glycosyltransferase [Flagellimonas lutaonensis]|uniref:Glycosyl transferase family 2 n=1 Tax=Flagellimonas lutaonensis TaxID=516051 RepID=A0A0D5YXH1_9FLAO|nr:glycosyltransferase [Allomuricauda lutaonensis]AKA36574.1 Glycosyl transferase family 2 [Allomuricauda lutaonensis]
MDIKLSFIIPVFNRPDEVDELLQSLVEQDFDGEFEVVIIEDGSTETSEGVIGRYIEQLSISYYQKENTGPGDSRNYGMKKAKGNYFIVLDSDCVLPSHYLNTVYKSLQNDFVHCFGGPDAAHSSFTTVQKAINYAMTSFLTTGGIRGKKRAIGKFQPRSFNMGISREAFEKTGGFGNIHPGEDPDLTFRIWKMGYETRLFENAHVFHKRRIDWGKYFKQVNKFGMVRPILNKWHPETAKLTYWFPTIFMIGLLVSLCLSSIGIFWPLYLYGLYFILVFVDSAIKNKSLPVAFLSVFACVVQFTGYGLGFIKSTILVNFSNQEPEQLFPKLFFKNLQKRD